jgi:saccharopine dehydrogenase-like NADP-dependent oxidoreductase
MQRLPDDDVLVVGASGILAPAAETLARRGVRVTGIGRSRSMPSAVEPILVDASDAVALAAVLGDRRWSAALVYDPAVSEASMRVITRAVSGEIVRVRTSAAADPALGELHLPAHTLLLGWAEGEEVTRWHRPDEVSEAALQVLADGEPRVLGAVRPWGRRP